MSMENKKKAGRPRKYDRVDTHVSIDRHLYEWLMRVNDKSRNDIINEVLEAHKQKCDVALHDIFIPSP